MICYSITVKRGNGSTLRWEHIMALEKLIKNSIDTDNHYASLYSTAVSLYETAFGCIDDAPAEIIIGAYKVAARELQEELWCEWGLWLEAHNCDKAEFHEALANVLRDGVNDIWEARVEAEFREFVKAQKAA